MTATLDERVTDLADRMDRQEHLRAAQDRDLADISAALRAQQGSIQALATTQSEHTELLTKHTEMLTRLTATADRHTATLKEISTTQHLQSLKLNEVTDGAQQIIGMLDTLTQRDGQG